MHNIFLVSVKQKTDTLKHPVGDMLSCGKVSFKH